MTTDEMLLEAVCAAGPGSHVLLVLADWCEDHGRDADAAAWRWLHRRGKWPLRATHPSSAGEYYWYAELSEDRTFHLPPVIYRELEVAPGYAIRGMYSSLPAALLAFVRAFALTPAAAPA